MGAAENRARSQKNAEYMKSKRISRSTGSCPWGCGAQISHGMQPLMNHLQTCEGGAAAKRRRAKQGGRRRR